MQVDGGPEFGIGAPVRRVEDVRLTTGRGHYADDILVPATAIAYVVRSSHAHARIAHIDKRAAAAMPGVIAVLTGADVMADGIGALACGSVPTSSSGRKSYAPTQPVLVSDTVRHVGDRVALIVAESLAAAKDAAEVLQIEYELLPAVTLADALDAGSQKVWADSTDNVSFQFESGDSAAVERIFAAAAHVTTLSLHYPRASASTLEPRSTIAYHDPIEDRYTLCSATQNPFRVRDTVVRVLGLSPAKLRVRALDVGGSFGMKGQVYPEDVLVVWAARKTGRPVKWTADRNESFASDMHGRHQITEAALALDGDGRILVFRTSVRIDVGAYLGHSAATPPHNAGVSYPGTYHVPAIHSVVRAVFTHSSQLGPYRGSAKPEASFVLERLVDKAARELGIDPVALRRRNLIAPDAMPYKAPGGYVYDSGDFERALDMALSIADWDGFAERRTLSEQKGLRRGIGVALHCQRAGTASERMEIRVARDGSLDLHVGTLATGQGHETMFAQMASQWLGVPIPNIRVVQGDTDKLLFGKGSFAQRSTSTGGSALRLAADEVIRKGRRLAAHMLEVAETDVTFDNGVFRVPGTDLKLDFRALVERSYGAAALPPELGIGLDGVGVHQGPNTYPNGCMICEVEVDTETGVVRVVRPTAVDDAGTVVNPLTLHGQLHGSVAQGLGEALMESIVYERGSGQLLTASFMDYAMPRADVMPNIVSELSPVPTKTNLIGAKGGSEAGNVATPAAIVNAVIDALAPLGVTDIPLPATSEAVWRAIQAARRGH